MRQPSPPRRRCSPTSCHHASNGRCRSADPAAATIPDAAAATASGPHSFPASAADVAGPIDYLSVLETAADIARGMAHLHACNIVHLDLKVWGGPGPDELQVYVCGGGGRAMHIGCRAMRARFNPIPFVARLFCMGLQLLPSHCPL